MKALLFAVFLSVIQATPPIPRQAPDSSTSTTGKSQSQANPQKTPPAQTESPVNANQTPSDDARRGEPRDHNAEHAITVSKLPPVTVSSPHRDWADWGTWGFNLLLAVTSGFQVWLLCKTLKFIGRQTHEMTRQRVAISGQLETMRSQSIAMDKQALAAEKSAALAEVSINAAIKSMEIAANKERPRIRVEPHEPRLEMKAVSNIPYEIDFWCPTICFITDAQVEAYLWGGKEAKTPFYVPINPPNTVRENTKMMFYAVVFDALPDDALAQIAAKKLRIYFRGFIEYRGSHLTDKDPSYRTPFHRQWVPLAGIQLPGMKNGFWQEYGDGEENQPT